MTSLSHHVPSPEENTFVESVLGSLSAHISVVDTTGKIISVNRAWNQFALDNQGVADQTGVGANYLAICERAGKGGDKYAEMAGKGIREVLAGRRDAFFLEYPCHAPHERRWFMMRVTPLQGAVNGAVIAHENITERKLAEEQTQKFAQQLMRRNEALEVFAIAATHDMQEPLRKIQAFLSRVFVDALEDLGPQATDYLQRSEQAARRIHYLIDDLLTYFKLASDQTRTRPQRVDLNEIIKNVMEDLHPLIQAQAGKINFEPLPIIEGDPALLHLLIQNLLSNSLRFRKAEQAPQVEIHVTDQNEDQITLCFQDNGIGFDNQYKEVIFKPFQRLKNLPGGGTGLGLAISREVVTLHRGSLWVESVAGQGSKFLLRLPRRWRRIVSPSF